MEANEFKKGLKSIKEEMKGMSLRLISKNSAITYYSLKSFGEEILRFERCGLSFYIKGVYTNDGIIKLDSFKKLKQLINSGIVTGIIFDSYYVPKSLNEAMQLFGGLD